DAGTHAGVKKSHECIEAIFVCTDDETTQWRGKQLTPGGFALFAPGRVSSAFSGVAFERHQTTGRRIVGGKRFLRRKGAFPRIIDAKTHRLVTTLENGPALGFGARWKIAEPEKHAMLGRGAGEKTPWQH